MMPEHDVEEGARSEEVGQVDRGGLYLERLQGASDPTAEDVDLDVMAGCGDRLDPFRLRRLQIGMVLNGRGGCGVSEGPVALALADVEDLLVAWVP